MSPTTVTPEFACKLPCIYNWFSSPFIVATIVPLVPPENITSSAALRNKSLLEKTPPTLEPISPNVIFPTEVLAVKPLEVITLLALIILAVTGASNFIFFPSISTFWSSAPNRILPL